MISIENAKHRLAKEALVSIEANGYCMFDGDAVLKIIDDIYKSVDENKGKK